MSIGLGKTKVISALEVIWPSMKKTYLKDVDVDQILVLSEKDAKETYTYVTDIQPELLTDVTQESGLNFRHKEDNYVDFYNESLIPYQLSKMGGNASVGDVNADGNDDVYFEGAKGQNSQLFLGTDKGALILNNKDQPWAEAVDVDQEDTASLFLTQTAMAI